MTTYRMATVDGHRIFYREAGRPDAPAVLLLHGFPTSSHMFRNLIPLLADRFRVVAPDLPGFGFSDAPDRAVSRTPSTARRDHRPLHRRRRARALCRLCVRLRCPSAFAWRWAHPERISGHRLAEWERVRGGAEQGWNPIQAYWREPTEERRAALREFLAPEATSGSTPTGSPIRISLRPRATRWTAPCSPVRATPRSSSTSSWTTRATWRSIPGSRSTCVTPSPGPRRLGQERPVLPARRCRGLPARRARRRDPLPRHGSLRARDARWRDRGGDRGIPLSGARGSAGKGDGWRVVR